MAVREHILDGLAWASLTEQARVSRVSAELVRSLPLYNTDHTKTDIKAAVKNTSPPYGRAKFINAAVAEEYKRQLPIYRDRQEQQVDWKNYLEHMSKRATRLNHAYAAAFDRVPYQPRGNFPGGWSNYDARQKWEDAENTRDKGDECLGISHQGGHVVALVESENSATRWHIATRLKSGPIVRTYLRTNAVNTDQPKSIAEAAISLGGPKVKAAITKGKKVVTDWLGRKTYIHHEGQDYHEVMVETLNWRITSFVERPGYGGRTETRAVVAELVDGAEVTVPDDRHPGYRNWNDID